MQITKIFQMEDAETSGSNQPWSQADLEGWSYVLVWKVHHFHSFQSVSDVEVFP